MSIRNALLVVCFTGLAIPCAAQQRPLVTEDPETVGVNHVLVEGGVEIATDQSYPAYGLKGDTTHGPSFGVSVGISPNAEIQIDGGFRQRLTVSERTTAPLSGQLTFTGDTASSLEDFTVATKLRIVSETAQLPGFGLRFGTKLPTAKRGSGMGLGTTDFFATLLAAKTVRSVRTVGNLGVLVLGDPTTAQGSATALGFGLSVARALTNELEAVGEINGHMNPFGDTTPVGLESRAVFRVAGRYTHKLLRFDLGVLLGVTSRDPSFGISAGATYVFGR